MNWGNCYSGSNNIHFGFPPMMSDGRNFASWLPGDQINNSIRQDNGIKSNWDYRQYLVKNAEDIMQQNAVEACGSCCSCPPVYGDDQPTPKGTPFLYQSCLEETQPYGYETSDMKELYLSEYQLQARMSAPILSQYHYLNGRFANYN